MNFQYLKNFFAEQLGTESSTDLARIGRVINYLQTIIGSYCPYFLLETKTFTTVSGTLNYDLNDITAMPSATTLSVASDDSGDTSVAIRIIGISSGTITEETITTNASDGTTSSAGSTTFQQVLRVEKPATTGTITVTASSTTIAILTATETSQADDLNKIVAVRDLTNDRFLKPAHSKMVYNYFPNADGDSGTPYIYEAKGDKTIDLYAKPNGAYNMKVWYYKLPKPLVNNNDICDIPLYSMNILETGVYGYMGRQLDYTDYQNHILKFEGLLKGLQTKSQSVEQFIIRGDKRRVKDILGEFRLPDVIGS